MIRVSSGLKTSFFLWLILCLILGEVRSQTTLLVEFPDEFKTEYTESEVQSPTVVIINWAPIIGAQSYQLKGRVAGGGGFKTIYSDNYWKFVGGLTPGQSYEWKVRAICTAEPMPGGLSQFSDLDGFTMPIERYGSPVLSGFGIERVFPVPTAGNLHIHFKSESNANTALEVYDLDGHLKVKRSIQLNEGLNLLEINSTYWDSGVYVLRLGDYSTSFIVSK